MAGLQAIAAGVLVLLAAYCLGSLPTALVVSRLTAHADIRELGDGNMGARHGEQYRRGDRARRPAACLHAVLSRG